METCLKLDAGIAAWWLRIFVIRVHARDEKHLRLSPRKHGRHAFA